MYNYYGLGKAKSFSGTDVDHIYLLFINQTFVIYSFFKFLFFIYIVIFGTILINLLIAMIHNTYDTIFKLKRANLREVNEPLFF